jgi:predicted PurR-regulated permease PerM
MESKSKESVTPSPITRKGDSPARSRVRRASDSAWWWIRSAAIVLTLYFGWLLLERVWTWISAVVEVAVLGLFGIVLALVVQPMVEALEHRASMPRSAAILAVLGGLVAILVLGGVLVAGPLVGEADALSRQVPKLVDALQGQYDQLVPRLRAHGVPVNPQLVAGFIGGAFGDRLTSLVLGGLAATIRLLVDTVIVLVVAFWILKDGAYFRRNFLRMLPVPVRSQVAFGFQATSAVVGGYVRAQVLIATALGLAAGAGCWLLGVPDPLVIGLAAGLFELVPIVGPFAGGAVGVTLALTVSPLLALWTLLLFLGLHILEGYVLAPRVQARFTRIPEVVAFLSVFAGLEAGGFLGALFAVPTVSLIAIFLRAAIGDLKAEHPELFEARGPELTERRRRIVQEFRGSWWGRLRSRVRRRQVG